MPFEIGQLVRIPENIAQSLGWHEDLTLGIVVSGPVEDNFGGHWVYIPTHNKKYAFWGTDQLTCYPPTRAGGGRSV